MTGSNNQHQNNAIFTEKEKRIIRGSLILMVALAAAGIATEHTSQGSNRQAAPPTTQGAPKGSPQQGERTMVPNRPDARNSRGVIPGTGPRTIQL